jgi:hypothetical protein
MWKLVKLFFKLKAVPKDLPHIIEQRVEKICNDEAMPTGCISFRRGTVNYFIMQFQNVDTFWGFYFDSLEID